MSAIAKLEWDINFWVFQALWIMPGEIEAILNEHEMVEECLVIGVEEPTVQQLVSAIVVLKVPGNAKGTEVN